MDISNLSSGAYLLEVFTENGRDQIKIIKQ